MSPAPAPGSAHSSSVVTCAPARHLWRAPGGKAAPTGFWGSQGEEIAQRKLGNHGLERSPATCSASPVSWSER